MDALIRQLQSEKDSLSISSYLSIYLSIYVCLSNSLSLLQRKWIAMWERLAWFKLSPVVLPFYFLCTLFEEPVAVLNANQQSHRPVKDATFLLLTFTAFVHIEHNFSQSTAQVRYQNLFPEFLVNFKISVFSVLLIRKCIPRNLRYRSLDNSGLFHVTDKAIR